MSIDTQGTLTTQPGAEGADNALLNGGAPATPPAPAPGAAPAAAPTAPAKVELEAEKPPVETDDSREQTFTYDPTGNASLDYALKFVGDLGYGANHPAIQAAQDGNFALIRAELAREGVRGADAVIALAEEAFKVESAKHEAQAKELQSFAEAQAGGPDNWNAVRAWASSTATPQEKQQVNAALAQGGMIAQATISFLVQQYSKVNTLPKSPAPVARAGAATAQVQVNGPLSAAEYGRAVQELMLANGGRDVSNTREYADLQARRLAGRRQGI